MATKQDQEQKQQKLHQKDQHQQKKSESETQQRSIIEARMSGITIKTSQENKALVADNNSVSYQNSTTEEHRPLGFGCGFQRSDVMATADDVIGALEEYGGKKVYGHMYAELEKKGYIKSE